MLMTETPGHRGALAVSLFGGLFLLAVVAKTIVGIPGNTQQQATVPLHSQFFKIVSPFSKGAGEAVQKITLPGYVDGTFSFLMHVTAAKNSVHNPLGRMGDGSTPPAGTDQAASSDPAENPDPSASVNRSALLHPIIDRAAARYQVDPALVRAIIFAESGYDATAVSKRGAMGLMQLMPQTARAMGVKDCFNPEHNINGGVKYFKKLYDQFDGDIRLALAAYNAGSRKVRKFNGVPPFGATERYIRKVMKYYKKFKRQEPEPLNAS